MDLASHALNFVGAHELSSLATQATSLNYVPVLPSLVRRSRSI